MGSRSPITGPVHFALRAQFLPPLSWSKKKRDEAMNAWCISKVDVDNIVKAWSDALNGIVYLDDNQIVSIIASKKYGPEDVVVVTVWAL